MDKLFNFDDVIPFTDKKDIEDYLNNDRIECLICGKTYKSLGFHLVRAHKISVDLYKKYYGLPWTKGLCGNTTKALFVANANNLRSKGLLATGILSKEQEKNLHKTGSRRITPSHSLDRSKAFKKLSMDKAKSKNLDLDECKKLIAQGLSQREVGRIFNVCQSTIRRFIKKENKYQKETKNA